MSKMVKITESQMKRS